MFRIFSFEYLEQRRLLSGAFEVTSAPTVDLVPPVVAKPGPCFEDPATQLQGYWIGQALGKDGVPATIELAVKFVDVDGTVYSTLTYTPAKGQAITIDSTGFYSPLKSGFELTWGATREQTGSITGTFDPATGSIVGSMEMVIDDTRTSFDLSLSKKSALRYAPQQAGPLIAGTWTGHFMDKEGFVSTVFLKISELDRNGSLAGEIELNLAPKDISHTFAVEGQYFAEKGTFFVTWGNDKDGGGLNGAVDKTTGRVQAELSIVNEGARVTYAMTLERTWEFDVVAGGELTPL